MDFIPIAKPAIGEEEIAAVGEVLRSGMLVQGAAVKSFEEAFSAYIHVKHSVAVSNGTVALDLALKALRLHEGDEVICPAFTFIATANAILYQGMRPVFADVDPRTFNLDPESVNERITSKTRAVIGVHLYGQPFDVDAIGQICEDRAIPLIEDCAQAHGAQWHGRRVGSFATGCFSFYPTKNMTTGEGGIITTNSDSLAQTARLLRNHGDTGKYNHVLIGYNYRMTNIQGAIGLAQVKKLDGFIESRIANARFYKSHINAHGITLPYSPDHVKHVYNQFVLKVEDGFPMSRDSFASWLQSKGIGSGIHYPKPVYRQPVYSKLAVDSICPVAEDVSKRVISIPVYPGLGDEQLRYIADTVNSAEA